jgi:hypothetical protein
LKEWKFDKYISAGDMSILVAKGEKRARQEDKETVFYRGAFEIKAERLEQFKRRKATKNIAPASPSAGMPFDW